MSTSSFVSKRIQERKALDARLSFYLHSWQILVEKLGCPMDNSSPTVHNALVRYWEFMELRGIDINDPTMTDVEIAFLEQLALSMTYGGDE